MPAVAPRCLVPALEAAGSRPRRRCGAPTASDAPPASRCAALACCAVSCSLGGVARHARSVDGLAALRLRLGVRDRLRRVVPGARHLSAGSRAARRPGSRGCSVSKDWLAHANLAGRRPAPVDLGRRARRQPVDDGGVAVMIGSFRETVVYWVGQTLQADLFISPGARRPLDPSRRCPPVSSSGCIASRMSTAVDRFRSIDVPYGDTWCVLGGGEFDVRADARIAAVQGARRRARRDAARDRPGCGRGLRKFRASSSGVDAGRRRADCRPPHGTVGRSGSPPCITTTRAIAA